jgi:PAS domain S-box-containing protein
MKDRQVNTQSNGVGNINSLDFKLFDAIPHMTWVSLPTGEIIFYNSSWFNYTGLDFDQSKKAGWQSVVHPNDLQETMHSIISSLTSGNSFEIETRYKRWDGEYCWHLNKAMPVKNENGEITLWVGTATEIHALKKTEEILKRNETKLRSVIAAAPAAIGLFIGKDLVVEMPNNSFIEIVGKGPDIEGKPLREVMPELETENQPYLNILDEVFTKGEMFQSLASQVKIMKQGVMTDNYYNITYTPLFNSEGEVYAILDIAVDVTEQVRIRESIEKSEQNLRNVILKAPVAMCIFKGPDFVVEVANERMIEFWGKSSEEVMGKPVFEGLQEVRGQGFEELLQKVYTTGETFTAPAIAVRLLRKGKIELVFVNFVYEASRDTLGNINGIIAVASEVTEQVLAQQKIEEQVIERTKELAQANDNLKKINQELKRSNINLEEFAYAASHDLKEPVRKINFFSDRLKNSLQNKLNEEEISYFNRMEAASRRMGSLIEDLLSFSQVSLRPRVFENVDMNLLIDFVLSDLDLEIEQKKAQIEVGELFTMKGHHRQLQQAFQNLLGNALKYSKPGVPPRVNISCNIKDGADIDLPLSAEERNKRFYIIEIADNGIGFEAKDADRIFNVFTRLHGNSEYLGTGVGLSIVRKVIENHQGYVTAQSHPGEGSVFKVFFPEMNNTG